jgi:hypothetical protein
MFGGKTIAYSRVEHLKGSTHNVFIRLAPVLLLINSVVSTVKENWIQIFIITIPYIFVHHLSAMRGQCYKNTTVNYSGIFNPTFSRVKMTLKNDFRLKNITAILG